MLEVRWKESELEVHAIRVPLELETPTPMYCLFHYWPSRAVVRSARGYQGVSV